MKSLKSFLLATVFTVLFSPFLFGCYTQLAVGDDQPVVSDDQQSTQTNTPPPAVVVVPPPVVVLYPDYAPLPTAGTTSSGSGQQTQTAKRETGNMQTASTQSNASAGGSAARSQSPARSRR